METLCLLRWLISIAVPHSGVLSLLRSFEMYAPKYLLCVVASINTPFPSHSKPLPSVRAEICGSAGQPGSGFAGPYTPSFSATSSHTCIPSKTTPSHPQPDPRRPSYITCKPRSYQVIYTHMSPRAPFSLWNRLEGCKEFFLFILFITNL